LDLISPWSFNPVISTQVIHPILRQLAMATSYTVEVHHQGSTYTLTVPEDQTILAAAHAAGVDLPTSCGAGVCTTCAALILEGEVDQTDGMGVSPDLQAQGYALLCVAYPRSDIKLESEKEDVVYQKQFGQG
jgi:ferredoxin